MSAATANCDAATGAAAGQLWSVTLLRPEVRWALLWALLYATLLQALALLLYV